jgi:hypothetical protein
VTVFIAVLGAAPGVGKSTLCSGLAAALPGRVDHFREEEILTRPAYAEVAAEFRAGGEVRPSTLLAATSAFVGRCDGDFVVTDALFPYLPSLRAWGHSPAALASFLAALAERDLTLDLLSSWDLHVLPAADPVVLLRAATEIVTG